MNDNFFGYLVSTDEVDDFLGYEPYQLFAADGEYIKSLGMNPFGGETPTTVLAEEWANKLKIQSSDNFDPLA